MSTSLVRLSNKSIISNKKAFPSLLHPASPTNFRNRALNNLSKKHGAVLYPCAKYSEKSTIRLALELFCLFKFTIAVFLTKKCRARRPASVFSIYSFIQPIRATPLLRNGLSAGTYQRAALLSCGIRRLRGFSNRAPM